MKKITIVMLCILVVGLCLGAAGFAHGGMKALAFGWHDGKLVRAEGFNDMVKVDEDFGKAKITNLVVDIEVMRRVLVTEGDTFSVKGQNWRSNGGLKATLDGKTLTVGPSEKDGIWKNLLSFDWKSDRDCTVTITVPKGAALKTLDAHVNVASLRVENVAADEAAVSSDVGEIEIEDVTAERLTVETNVGDAKMSGVDAGSAEIQTDIGELRADALRAKDLTFESNVGSGVFTGLVIDGTGVFKADTGEIEIAFDMDEDEVDYEVDSDVGDVRVDGRKVDDDDSPGASSAYAHRADGAKARVTVETNVGGVKLSFR